MCLILLAWHQHPDYPLIIAANRDEFYRRPSASLSPWNDAPILAGRDLEAGGTWLGVNRQGHLAAVTNIRNPAAKPGSLSRGQLTSDFLRSGQNAASFAKNLQNNIADYSGFNLLLHDGEELWYAGTHSAPERLCPGLFGLSNASLNSRWPKVKTGVQAMQQWLQQQGSAAELMEILASRERPSDNELPDTGIGLDRERLLAPRFIRAGNYGTRASTVVLVSKQGDSWIWERSFNADGDLADERAYHWQYDSNQPRSISPSEFRL